MKPSDKPEFVKQIVGLAAIKPGGAKLTAESYEIYFNALRHWTLDAFKAAAAHLATSIEFMPSPFHFEELRKAGRPVPAEAWIHARAIARAWRPNLTAPTSGDALLDRTVASIGGYRAIAMCQLDSMCFMEKRFIEAYESLRDVEDTRAALPMLAGDRPATRLIGPTSMQDMLKRIAPPPKESAK